jgi:hypothetical protein
MPGIGKQPNSVYDVCHIQGKSRVPAVGPRKK